MKAQKQGHSALDEISALKEKFNNIKDETEDFVVRVKKLSDSGVQEAKELLEASKANWHSLTESFGGITEMFSKSKKSTSRSKSKPASQAPKKASKKAAPKKVNSKKRTR